MQDCDTTLYLKGGQEFSSSNIRCESNNTAVVVHETEWGCKVRTLDTADAEVKVALLMNSKKMDGSDTLRFQKVKVLSVPVRVRKPTHLEMSQQGVLIAKH